MQPDRGAVLDSQLASWHPLYVSMTLPAVRELARQLHDGQTDKAGRPYFGHVERVAALVARAGGSIEQQIAAYLHDGVESGRISREALAMLPISNHVQSMLEALTQAEREPRAHYINRVRSVPAAVLVKRCDIADNTAPDRMALLDEPTQRRLTNKYVRDLAQLLEPPLARCRSEEDCLSSVVEGDQYYQAPTAPDGS